MTPRWGEVEDAKLDALFSTGKLDHRDTSTKACRQVYDAYFSEQKNYTYGATRYRCKCQQWEVFKSLKNHSKANRARKKNKHR
jgi:hypothetical protein